MKPRRRLHGKRALRVDSKSLGVANSRIIGSVRRRRQRQRAKAQEAQCPPTNRRTTSERFTPPQQLSPSQVVIAVLRMK